MVEMAPEPLCPDCGTPLSDEAWAVGLCLPCLAELAKNDTGLEAELAHQLDDAPTLEFEAETLPAGSSTLIPGEVHGERYRIRSLLGRGGMGEVWRAFDLKLRLDVALKSLRGELVEDEQALEALRQEVRAAREVISPNVCRVFDLQELDGRELLSMEYIAGTTLQEILNERGPLELDEAREIASQFLAGLEAIHDAGLVHRDIKPENVMVTRTGRVVVMDFGIAKSLGEGRTGVAAGTPAYMSPEQSKGGALDARSDVFSAGVVLAEMVEPRGTRSLADRQRVWKGIHQERSEIAETAWSGVIARAIAREMESRFVSASALSRALEEVTLRATGDEDVDPYPGLASFTEDQSKYFFGRELEVEALWKKLRRPHLLALIGPSGAGKSSFLRAGLLPTLPEDWGSILVTPGDRPFQSLVPALAKQMSNEPSLVDELLRFEEPEAAVSVVKRWRDRHAHGLIIVDQFEELFTQSPPDTQERFSDLLGLLPLEADTFVLLSMREDFHFHCQPFEALAPVFSEITPLGALGGSSLRRALVQPALKCGYRFESDQLIDAMVSEVSHERGALPLLAFAASQLWAKRDREQGLLTREAYAGIGGVGGALGQHAEATLEQIGGNNLPFVRELFRNLVTAQGTRVARDRDELLSVFEESEGEPSGPRGSAASVLDALIGARLLTSYDVLAAKGEKRGRTRLEIIHESLITSWPRLVRWRSQDAEGAQLRDELWQSAQRWDERGRSEDLLWTGTSFKEFELWRERYPGGLTELEEEYGKAMTAKAERRKRRRRLGIGAAFAVLLSVLAVVGVSRQQAIDAARRSEASKLLALGQLELESDPATALAYATQSLELADNPETRLFALGALSLGPPARIFEYGDELAGAAGGATFSPDGKWMALHGQRDLGVVSRDGSTRLLLATFPTTGGIVCSRFSPEGNLLLATKGGELRIWSVPEFEEIDHRKIPVPEGGGSLELLGTEKGYFVYTSAPTGEGGTYPVITPLSAVGAPGPLRHLAGAGGHLDIDPTGRWLGFYEQGGREVFLRSLEDWEAPPRLAGIHAEAISTVSFHPDGRRIAAADRGGEVRIWSTTPPAPEPLRIFAGVPGSRLVFDAAGDRLAVWGRAEGGFRAEVWDLRAPAEATPMAILVPDLTNSEFPAFSPDGRWWTTDHSAGSAFWPVSRPQPMVLTGSVGQVNDLAFTADGRGVVSLANGATASELRVWDLQAGGRSRVLASFTRGVRQLAVDPQGRVVLATVGDEVLVVPMAGGPHRTLEGPTQFPWPVALDVEGRRAAAASLRGPPEVKGVIRIWDLDTDEMRTLGPVRQPDEDESGVQSDLEFLPIGQLVSVGEGGLRLWDIEAGTSEVLAPTGEGSQLTIFGGGRWAAYTQDEDIVAITDLETRDTKLLPSHGAVWPVAVDPSGEVIVSASDDGMVRVGPVTGEEPHLLLGHEGLVRSVAISPDGRWIASGGDDGTIRLWPMPDLSKPPLHTLPHEELLAKLRSLTNIEVVEDPDSATGWKLEVGPFPGWEEVPTW